MLNETTLANGVRIISQSMSGHRNATLGFWLQNGSRHDGHQRQGFAHLLEHLLAGSLYSDRLGRRPGHIGSQVHASSGRDLTVWHGTVPGRDLSDLAMRLSSMLLTPHFQSGDLKREQAIICHELSDDGDGLIDYICSLVWPGQSVGLPPGGNAQTLTRANGEIIEGYLRQCIQGRNLVITAAGAVKHDALVNACRQLESITNDVVTALPSAPPRFIRCQTHVPLQSDRARLCWAIPVPAADTADLM